MAEEKKPQGKTATSTEPEAKSKPKKQFDHLWAIGFLEKVVGFAKKQLPEKVLNFALDWVYRIGHFGLMAAAVLGFLFALLVAIRLDSFTAFLFGVCWVALVFVIQYTAHRFSRAGDTLIENNPSSLSSKAFLDCFGFLAVIGGLILLIYGIVRSIQGAGIWYLLVGIAAFIILELYAVVAFNPGIITTETGKKTSAGQEAIGIIVFFIKGLMRLVPILFGIGIIAGLVLLFIDFLGVFKSEIRLAEAWANAPSSAQKIVISGLLPFLSYIFFVLYYLGIDIIRAILSIPDKLEELKKK